MERWGRTITIIPVNSRQEEENYVVLSRTMYVLGVQVFVTKPDQITIPNQWQPINIEVHISYHFWVTSILFLLTPVQGLLWVHGKCLGFIKAASSFVTVSESKAIKTYSVEGNVAVKSSIGNVGNTNAPSWHDLLK